MNIPAEDFRCIARILAAGAGIAYSGWYLGARAPLIQSTAISSGVADNPSSGIPNTTQFPIAAGSLTEEYKMPTMYNYSFGIQTLLPYETQLDVSYVGNSAFGQVNDVGSARYFQFDAKLLW